MKNKSNKPLTDEHNRPPADDTTRKKIDKHLSDIDDTISEEDIQNINTDIGTNTAAFDNEHLHDVDQADEMKGHRDAKDDPEKEPPSSWEILGE